MAWGKKAALAACAAFGLATAAVADPIVIGGGGGEWPGCGDAPCGPDDPTPQPFPGFTEQYLGQFRVQVGGAEEGGVLRMGQYQYENTFGFDSSYHPIGANGLTYGDAGSSIFLQIKPATPNTEATAEVHAQSSVAGTTFSDAGYQAIYKIHADSMGDADIVAAAYAANHSLAHAVGSYTLNATGSGVAEFVIRTGQDLSGGYVNTVFNRCDPNGSIYQVTTDQCGTTQYAVAAALVRGDRFIGGDAQDFYAAVWIEVAGTVVGDLGPGTAYGFIDPQLQFGSELSGLNLTVSAADNVPQAISFAPEPASWATMLTGFGLLGGAMRRRKLLVA